MRPLSGHWNPGCNQQAGKSLKYYHPRACRAIAVETQEARHHSTQLNQPCWHSTAIRQLSNSGSLPSVLFLEYELFYRYFWPLHVSLRRENPGFCWWEKGFYFSAIFCSWSSPTSLVAQNNSFYHGLLEEQENRPSQQSYLPVFGKRQQGWIGLGTLWNSVIRVSRTIPSLSPARRHRRLTTWVGTQKNWHSSHSCCTVRYSVCIRMQWLFLTSL